MKLKELLKRIWFRLTWAGYLTCPHTGDRFKIVKVLAYNKAIVTTKNDYKGVVVIFKYSRGSRNRTIIPYSLYLHLETKDNASELAEQAANTILNRLYGCPNENRLHVVAQVVDIAIKMSKGKK